MRCGLASDASMDAVHPRQKISLMRVSTPGRGWPQRLTALAEARAIELSNLVNDLLRQDLERIEDAR